MPSFTRRKQHTLLQALSDAALRSPLHVGALVQQLPSILGGHFNDVVVPSEAFVDHAPVFYSTKLAPLALEDRTPMIN
jgi:hypothetical protein